MLAFFFDYHVGPGNQIRVVGQALLLSESSYWSLVLFRDRFPVSLAGLKHDKDSLELLTLLSLPSEYWNY